MSKPAQTVTVCCIPLCNWLAVRPHNKHIIYGQLTHQAKLTVETMDTSAVRGPHSPSVLLPHTLPGLNYAITASGLDAEYQWFQASAITTSGCSSVAALWLIFGNFLLGLRQSSRSGLLFMETSWWSGGRGFEGGFNSSNSINMIWPLKSPVGFKFCSSSH